MPIYKNGDIISFFYKGKDSTDFSPEVLVLNTSWKRPAFPNEIPKMHGLNLHVLTEQEQNYLRSLMNPDYADDLIKKNPAMWQTLKQKLTFAQYRSPVVGAKIENPLIFYNQVIKSFIEKYDSYRLYIPAKMTNIVVIEKREILTGKSEGLYSTFIKKDWWKK